MMGPMTTIAVMAARPYWIAAACQLLATGICDRLLPELLRNR